jgi:hypothetical protein
MNKNDLISKNITTDNTEIERYHEFKAKETELYNDI